MNYLAHILLSYPDNEEMLGNFLGDFVRNKHLENLPISVQNGVLLHRKIDHFTDRHPSVKNSIEILRPAVGRYASVAIDIINDHFLSQLWEDYADVDIRTFCDHFYELILSKKELLPYKLKGQIGMMIDHDFLMSTFDHFRLYKTMKHMDRRTSLKSNFTATIPILEKNESLFQENFITLFSCLIKMSNEKISPSSTTP